MVAGDSSLLPRVLLLDASDRSDGDNPDVNDGDPCPTGRPEANAESDHETITVKCSSRSRRQTSAMASQRKLHDHHNLVRRHSEIAAASCTGAGITAGSERDRDEREAPLDNDKETPLEPSQLSHAPSGIKAVMPAVTTPSSSPSSSPRRKSRRTATLNHISARRRSSMQHLQQQHHHQHQKQLQQLPMFASFQF
jgi:hypothetical protein